MQRRSPPKHRHDGTSPLPLGMDWSPPPRKLNDRDTIWPHDFRIGWSYFVKIPSWTLLPESDPVVFYRVEVSLQSPEGVTTMRGTLRRFNDFLKLLADLKRAFPKKSFPSAPPKGLLRVKSREMLEERRCSLEDWMTKLLCDIELSRSVVVASFLELEATARSACQGIASGSNDDGNITSLSSLVHPNLSFLHSGGSSLLSSDYGSDTAYETSELGSASLGQDDVSETGTEDLNEDPTNPTEKLVQSSMSNIEKGLSMSQNILEQLDDFPKHIIETDLHNGKAFKGVFRANNSLRPLSESETSHSVMHYRKLSSESADGLPLLASVTSTSGNLEMQGSGKIVLPLNMHKKLNRILLTMNERLVNSKTDMDDLIARLNQETAVKEYLNRKVDDLEVELETTIQRNKENLEQALTTERERITQMQWDMEELRQKSFKMTLKLKSKEDGSPHAKPTRNSMIGERHEPLEEMDATKQQLEDLSRRYEDLEAKSKADIKVLVREVKSMRRSHIELEKEVTRSLTEKSNTEELLQEEKKVVENMLEARKKLLSDCRILHDRLKVNSTNLSMDEHSNLPDALQDQIEAQLVLGCDETGCEEDELRKIIADIYAENIKLLKQVNTSSVKDENEKQERLR